MGSVRANIAVLWRARVGQDIFASHGMQLIVNTT